MYTGCVLYVDKVSIDHEILRTYRQTHKIFRRCKQFFLSLYTYLNYQLISAL